LRSRKTEWPRSTSGSMTPAGRDKQLQSHLEPWQWFSNWPTSRTAERIGHVERDDQTIACFAQTLAHLVGGSETVAAEPKLDSVALEWAYHYPKGSPACESFAACGGHRSNSAGGVGFQRILLVTGVRRVRVPLLAFLRASDFSGLGERENPGRRGRTLGSKIVSSQMRNSWIGLCATAAASLDRASKFTPIL